MRPKYSGLIFFVNNVVLLSSIRIEDINIDEFSYRFLEKFTYL